MARPKRMGAYSALDDLFPGPPPRLKPVPDPPRRSRRRARGRLGTGNALDDLLPGPRGLEPLDDLLPGPSSPSQQPEPAPRPRVLRRHLEVWNPLDALPAAGQDPTPARARVSFRLPADLVEAARDAVAHLAPNADPVTLTALAERALRAELARLAATHNHGHPFPPRAR
jgi:hypothetical protein